MLGFETAKRAVLSGGRHTVIDWLGYEFHGDGEEGLDVPLRCVTPRGAGTDIGLCRQRMTGWDCRGRYYVNEVRVSHLTPEALVNLYTLLVSRACDSSRWWFEFGGR